MDIEHIVWDLVPRSRARTSYDLLKDVIKAIRVDYRRINMAHWTNEVDPTQRANTPCGTQGCIAGWCSLMKSNSGEIYRKPFTHVRDHAASLMPESLTEWGLSKPPWDKLTLGSPEYPWPSDDLEPEEYGEAVVRNIEKFMMEHKRELQAHQIA